MTQAGSPSSGELVAHHAIALIGTRFRLHGRDRHTGVDCVGLVAVALAAAGASPVAPQGYQLRNMSIGRWLGYAQRSGLSLVRDEIEPGDVMLLGLSSVQHHLVIAVSESEMVHAHAGLRRVVLQQLVPPTSILARWRLTAPSQG